MKKIFIVLVIIAVSMAFISSAWAIDRAPQKSGSDSTTEIKEMAKEKAKEKQKPRKSTFTEKTLPSVESQKATKGEKSDKTKDKPGTIKGKEKYDYFIDRNNNGIDDRLEKDVKAKRIQKQKPIEKQKTIKKQTPAPVQKKPAKVSPTPKVPEKVKVEKAVEKKKEGSEIKAEKKESKRR